MAIETISTYTEGDTLPVLARTREGTDITGWTITLNVRQPSGGLTTVVATLDTPLTGNYSYSFTASGAGALVAGDGQPAEEVFDTGSGVFTLPLVFNVRAKV